MLLGLPARRMPVDRRIVAEDMLDRCRSEEPLEQDMASALAKQFHEEQSLAMPASLAHPPCEDSYRLGRTSCCSTRGEKAVPSTARARAWLLKLAANSRR